MSFLDVNWFDIKSYCWDRFNKKYFKAFLIFQAQWNGDWSMKKMLRVLSIQAYSTQSLFLSKNKIHKNLKDYANMSENG